MKRISINAGVMLLAFGIGYGTVVLFSLAADFVTRFPLAGRPQITVEAPPIQTSADGTIAVFVDDQFDVHITNLNSKPVTYSAYTRDMINFSYMRGGKKIPLGYCGTGLKDHVLSPGETLTIDRSESNLPYQVNQGKGKLQLGVWMKIDGSEYKEYWSNELDLKTVPGQEDMRGKIIDIDG